MPGEDWASELGSIGFLAEGTVSKMGNRCGQAAEKLSCVRKTNQGGDDYKRVVGNIGFIFLDNIVIDSHPGAGPERW